ncbi:hypothetical protein JTE90_016790 [Oedothorax gibbosus]|uniref:Peptidase S1 domain-containing protein n=1 Tax=Oedothorax gibbosus TaxID=931172 RepID=A0AAV6W0I9_9ARAC|nr:hypothetical protein JTE90_016790 [Oedothorax gibbosus]
MGSLQILRSNRQMAGNLLLSLFNCILLFSQVQAKAVEGSKHVLYAGQANSQTFPASEETFLKYSPTIASARIGKPLYFGTVETPSKSDNYEPPDRLELSNYENFEEMFDTEYLENPPSKSEFQEDQVFLHSTQVNRVKSKAKQNETAESQKKNLKLSNAGPPCENADMIDYKNKSSEIAPSINHNAMYGSKFEPKSQSIQGAISENSHQYKTKILHSNMDVGQTKNDDKSEFKENSKRFNDKSDYNKEKTEKLEPISNGLKNSEDISGETVNISSQVEEKNRDKFHLHYVDAEVSTGDKIVLNKKMNLVSDSKFRSFVFNPNAQPQEVFQACQTPQNESGHCRYIQHCMLPSILSSIRHFVDNVCIIQDQFIGVCCPEFPVSVVLVSWPGKQQDFAEDSVQVPEDCGVGTNRRIVGGLSADRKAWPWMVALLNNKLKFFCGGSLISNRYVLTAAHCTFGLSSGNQIIARLGEYDFNDPRDPHDDYPVIEIKRHGQYTRFTLRNDIAVLKLVRPVVFNEFVRTICLPEPEKDYLGKHTTLAGWGHLNEDSNSRRSTILQEASLTVIGNEECSATHGVPVAESVLCASAPTKDKGACNGDSGGPLMLLDSDERWKVVGIVSWGRRGCNPTFPTAYSRVAHYLDWIKEHAI